MVGEGGDTVRLCVVPPSSTERNRDRSQRKNAVAGAADNLLQHEIQQKEQAIEQFDRIVQLHLFAQGKRCLPRLEQMRKLARRPTDAGVFHPGPIVRSGSFQEALRVCPAC